MSPSLQVADALTASCLRANRRAADYLVGRQHSQGYWWGDLTADTTLNPTSFCSSCGVTPRSTASGIPQLGR